MNTCKDCKWWMRLGDSSNGECQKAEFGPIGNASMGTQTQHAGVYCWDVEIETGPDFGCIKWEGKDGHYKTPDYRLDSQKGSETKQS